MTWFRDARSTREWGGWAFRYPFDDKTFREDVQLSELDSFVARGEAGELIAFGQVRNKLGRGHIARLAVAPEHRGRGLGRELVNGLCEKAIELIGCSENCECPILAALTHSIIVGLAMANPTFEHLQISGRIVNR